MLKESFLFPTYFIRKRPGIVQAKDFKDSMQQVL